EVVAMLDHYAIFLQPLVNPDGHAADTREDSQGRDPNRDYAYPDRDEAHSFKLPEIKAVKDLSDQYQFRAAGGYHSGVGGVLWPWCYTSQQSPDQNVFYSMAKSAAESMGMDLYKQSYFDYPTNGEFIDYVYMKSHTVGLTFELSNDGNPPTTELADVVRRS